MQPHEYRTFYRHFVRAGARVFRTTEISGNNQLFREFVAVLRARFGHATGPALDAGGRLPKTLQLVRNAAHSGPEYHLVRSVVEMAYRQRSEARGARRGYVDPSDGAYARVVEKLREEVGVL